MNRSSSLLAAFAVLALAGILPAQDTNRNGPADFATFKVVSDRNIFDPSRRPARVYRSDQPRIVDSFSLVGTLAYAKGRFAVFTGNRPDYQKVLPQGGVIDGYTLANISQTEVKLVSGTNEVPLRVGMQMRRSQDGSWAAAEADPGVALYASNSGSRNSDRNDRRHSVSRRDFPRRDDSAARQPEPPPETTGPPPDMGEAMPAPEAPVIPLNLDPNDPVARMILRRLQETGGAPFDNGSAGPGGPAANGPPTGPIPDSLNTNVSPGESPGIYPER